MNTEKIIFLGSSGTGKTSLCRALVGKPVHQDEAVTIGVDFFETKLRTEHSEFSEGLQLQCWDTAGQEKYRSLVSLYYQNLTIVCLVFDLSRPSTLDELQPWLEQLSFFYPHISKPDKPMYTVQVILIGNKKDLPRQVDSRDAQAFALKHGMHYLESSSFEDVSVNSIFDRIIELAHRRAKAAIIRPRTLPLASQFHIYNKPVRPIRCCTLL